MAQRIALWAAAALFVVVGILAIWQGLPLAQLEESRYYFLTAILFFAAAALTVVRGLKNPGDGLVWGLGAGFAAFLMAVSAYLIVKGGQLASMGGSPYYVLTGLALLAVAVLMVLRNVWSARIYAAILAVTIVWSVFESGIGFWALLPRLAAFIVVGLWFLAPWTRALYVTPANRELPKLGYARWNIGGIAVGVVLLLVAAFQGYAVEPGSTFVTRAGNGITDWRNLAGTTLGSRFAEIDQINTSTVKKLKEIWRFRTKVPYDFKDTPLEVGGLVYVCTAGNTVIALDADTGQEKWRRAGSEKVPGGSGPSGLDNASTFARTCRGLGYYDMASTERAMKPAEPVAPVTPVAPGKVGPQPIPAAPAPAAAVPADCPTRIITGTTNAELIAIDAKTGQTCASFGTNGVVNLRAGLGVSPLGNYMVTSAPLVARDIVVVGGWVTDNQLLGNPSGVIRAYSARDGRFMWAWDLGKPEDHAMPDEGGQFTRGTPNAWSNMSYDPVLNLVYAPTGNSSPDYFAGELRTDQANKYSSSTVAIDAATGGAAWSFQTVHRDIWDYDVPSQPVLVNVRRNGEVIPAVAQPTKRGEIFLLDRRTGVPIQPVEERPVPQNPEKGEHVTATQPFSTLPNFRADRKENAMWGLTPLDQLYCRVEFRKMRYEGHFTPPMRGVTPSLRPAPGYEASYAERRIVGGEQSGGSFQYPGNAGGFNWGSISVDADNGLLIGAPMLMGNRITLSTAEDRKAQGEATRARQEQWFKDHPDDKKRFDDALAKAGGRGGPPGGPPAARAAAQGGPAGPGSRPAVGFNPEGGPAGQANQAFNQADVTYTGNTQPFMSNFHVPIIGDTQVPCFEPPWGVIFAMDLNTGKMMWKRPFGTMKESGPFAWKSGLPFEVGTPTQGSAMTTRGGLIFHAGAMDSTIRAYDERTGKVLWSAPLPGSAHTTPMSYLAPSGRQIVAVTVPNPSWAYPRSPLDRPTDDQGGWVIAYALEDM